MQASHLLLVRQKATEDERTAGLIKALAPLGLDAYSARQRLVGRGPAVMRAGDASSLAPLQQVVGDHGYESAVVEALPSPFTVTRVKALGISPEAVHFQTDEGESTLNRGDRVLAVLGELSGALVKKMLARSSLGGGALLGESDTYRAVLAGDPVLDLYILPAEARDPSLAVCLRLIPGRFNPRGLGDSTTASSVQNFDRVLRVVREMAGDFTLDLDFGLSRIPGADAQPGDGEALRTENLKRLGRYGWYRLQMVLTRGRQAGAMDEGVLADTPPALAEDGAGALAVAAAGMHDLLRAEDDQQRRHHGQPAGSDIPQEPALPPPPLPPGPTGLKGGVGAFLKARLAPLVVGGSFAAYFVIALIFLMLDSGPDADPGGEMLKAVMRFLVYWGIQRGVALFALCLVLFLAGFHYLTLKRFMENTPTSKARSLAMGMVEVKGAARRAFNLLSPMSMLPCVYYRLMKYRRVKDSKGNQHWQLVSDINSGHVPFYLEDDTGRVLVDPTDGAIRRPDRKEFTSGRGMLWGGSFLVGHGERYVEEILPEGASLYVLGFAYPKVSTEPTLRERVAARLRLLKQDRAALMRFDADANGVIDDREWDAARSSVEEAATADHLANATAARPQHEDLVVAKPAQRGLPFVLAQGSESGLTTYFTIYAALGLLASAASLVTAILMAAGVWRIM